MNKLIKLVVGAVVGLFAGANIFAADLVTEVDGVVTWNVSDFTGDVLAALVKIVAALAGVMLFYVTYRWLKRLFGART